MQTTLLFFNLFGGKGILKIGLLQLLGRGEMCHQAIFNIFLKNSYYFGTAFKMFLFPWEGMTHLTF